MEFLKISVAWVQRKLGDLGSVAMNKRIFKEQTSDTGDVPFYKIGTFGGTPDAFISRELFEEYKSKYQYPEVGDILISASGSIGRTVVYQGADEYFQDSNIVWVKHDSQLVNSFLKQFYSIVKWQGLEGSTIKRLYNKNILETPITLPSPEEQTKLGEFFEQLDNLIAANQQEHHRGISACEDSCSIRVTTPITPNIRLNQNVTHSFHPTCFPLASKLSYDGSNKKEGGNMNLGDRLQKLRSAHNLSQNELAEALFVT
jgi:restriction endonuclease S subunit